MSASTQTERIVLVLYIFGYCCYNFHTAVTASEYISAQLSWDKKECTIKMEKNTKIWIHIVRIWSENEQERRTELRETICERSDDAILETFVWFDDSVLSYQCAISVYAVGCVKAPKEERIPDPDIPTQQSDDGCGRFHFTPPLHWHSISLSLSPSQYTERQTSHCTSCSAPLRWVVHLSTVLKIWISRECSNGCSTLLWLSPHWNNLCPSKVLIDIVYCTRTKSMSVYTSTSPHPYGVLPTGKLVDPLFSSSPSFGQSGERDFFSWLFVMCHRRIVVD